MPSWGVWYHQGSACQIPWTSFGVDEGMVDDKIRSASWGLFTDAVDSFSALAPSNGRENVFGRTCGAQWCLTTSSEKAALGIATASPWASSARVGCFTGACLCERNELNLRQRSSIVSLFTSSRCFRMTIFALCRLPPRLPRRLTVAGFVGTKSKAHAGSGGGCEKPARTSKGFAAHCDDVDMASKALQIGGILDHGALSELHVEHVVVGVEGAARGVEGTVWSPRQVPAGSVHRYGMSARPGSSCTTALTARHPRPSRPPPSTPAAGRSRTTIGNPTPLLIPGAAAAPACLRPGSAHTTMAHLPADAAPSAQRQARRLPSRIVPAIPHRLSRTRNTLAARPLSPDESNTGAADRPDPEPQPAVDTQAKEPLPPAPSAEAPMTPDSHAATDARSEDGATVLAASPAESAHDHVERTAEHPDAINGRAATPPLADTGAKPAVNGARRKLAVPAELPPPFYPSSKSGPHTPTDLPHRSQLSAGAAAFNVANASPTVPSTPHEADHTVSFFPRHIPLYSQSNAIYENGAGHQSPSFPVGPAALPAHYNGSSTDATNGFITPHADSPSKSQFGQVQSGSERGDEQPLLSYQNGTPAHATRFDQSPLDLAAYLSTQFGNPQFADYILQIRSPDAVLLPPLPAHGIVIVRSPVLAEAVRHCMPNAHRSGDTRRMLDVVVADPFVTREALEEALKVLYGAPLLSAEVFLLGLAPYVHDVAHSSPSDARTRMRQLLSYIAAGKALQLPIMQARGVEFARLLLRWDTLEEVLRFALQCTTAFWPKNDGIDTEDPFMAALLNYVLEFMARFFPVDFNLYTIAPELEDIPRLPLLLEARSATHNPRLSKIRFGDAPPEDDLQPDHVSRVLSSVLLSLPLPLLDRLFNHRAIASQVGWTSVVRIMRDVIAEREHRRKRALKSDVRPAQDGSVPGRLLSNLYFEERVEQVEESALHPCGHRLVPHHLSTRG
ncbi:hypothetical protein BDU57DRAFT_526155 [Ampelomyces quisqualis]|uniref:Uncharacterized protein n=1 Tax=Ampelomyces quisqualis TaxID=50730 RepID=A0A6A5QZP1_AMPQU|nr:hypothetical protein BDU57DRAFT_526155 [Ampelomyces quisqualis]